MKLEFEGNVYAWGEDARDRPTEGVKTLTVREMEKLAGELLRADYELFTDPAIGGGQVFLLIGTARQALVPAPESGLKSPGYFFHVQEIGKVPESILEPPTTGLPPVNEGDVITIPPSGEVPASIARVGPEPETSIPDVVTDEAPKTPPVEGQEEVIQPKEMGGVRGTRGPDEAEEPKPAKPEDLEPTDPNEGKGDETPDPPKEREGA
jgi:hypothetical protein